MDLRLDNKTAMVCGSSQGIGKAIAEQFAEMGANLVLVARNEEMLESVCSNLANNGDQKHNYIAADFSDPDDAAGKIYRHTMNSEPATILVNNTGGPKPGTLRTEEPKNFYNALNMHVIMSQMLVQILLPGMKEAHFGRVINVISIGVKQPIDNLGVSNTIRGAMNAWSKTMASECAQYGITVNNLLPGQTDTERLQALIANIALREGKTPAEVTEEMKARIPLGRFGDPKELAYAAGFLASNQAAFITGTNLLVDGGFYRGF
jgi:3-oxoacyl-[acyl-carrier protein] reductase